MVRRGLHVGTGESKHVVAEVFWDPPTQMLNAEMKGNYSCTYAFGASGVEVEVDKETGEVILDNEINIATLQWLLDGINEGIFVEMPGGFCHSEEWYGYMNAGNVATIAMPLWYLNRFTDYMPDLKGKLLVMPNPVFEVGQPRSVGLGGTGTSVTNQSKNVDLAVDFLGFAKLSEEGNLKIWEIMGFDPIRKALWTHPDLKKPNKFIDYFANFPFDALIEVQDEIPAIVVSESLPKTMTAVRTSIMTRVFEGMEDIDTVLAEEQALLEQTPN